MSVPKEHSYVAADHGKQRGDHRQPPQRAQVRFQPRIQATHQDRRGTWVACKRAKARNRYSAASASTPHSAGRAARRYVACRVATRKAKPTAATQHAQSATAVTNSNRPRLVLAPGANQESPVGRPHAHATPAVPASRSKIVAPRGSAPTGDVGSNAMVVLGRTRMRSEGSIVQHRSCQGQGDHDGDEPEAEALGGGQSFVREGLADLVFPEERNRPPSSFFALSAAPVASGYPCPSLCR